jgi:hypothetical protein
MHRFPTKIVQRYPKYSRSITNSLNSSDITTSNLYPGLSSGSPSASWPVPANSPATTTPLQPTSPQSASNPLGSLLKGVNLEAIKTTVNKMGGIQGIIENMNKMQKLMASLQQMGPMLKLLFSSIGGKKSQASELQDVEESIPPSRRLRSAKRRTRNRRKLPAKSPRR